MKAFILKTLRAWYKRLGYRILDLFEGFHARMARRAWYTPGATAAQAWLSALTVSEPSSTAIRGQEVASLVVQNGIVLSGPAAKTQWASTPARVARMRRIARAAGLDLTGYRPAHYALLDNIVNRYIAEFASYPHQPFRTMNLLPGDVFIDIGAFRGYVSVKAAQKVGSQGRVYAIEPVAENFEYIEHHRYVNGIENITAVKAALTKGEEAATVELFRTENQGNAAIKEHLRGTTRTVDVDNLGARTLIRQVRSELPNARRIVCSVTTNGTEIEVAEAIIEALEPDRDACYIEIVIPVVFTEQEAKAFAAKIAGDGWLSDLRHPWLRLWRPAKVEVTSGSGELRPSDLE